MPFNFNFYQGQHANNAKMNIYTPPVHANNANMNIYTPPAQALKLPSKYCIAVKTPQKDLPYLAPYQYDIKNPQNQPTQLQILKGMHNHIANSVLDGTQGVVPGESFIQQKMLNDLKTEIDKFCN